MNNIEEAIDLLYGGRYQLNKTLGRTYANDMLGGVKIGATLDGYNAAIYVLEEYNKTKDEPHNKPM
jgi:hypothetical protein